MTRCSPSPSRTSWARDGDLARLVTEHGIPVLWQRPAGFPSLVLLILEQQVSLASAAAAYGKVVARTGAMTPAALLATTPEELRLDGVSRQKDRYLRALATAVETGTLDLAGLSELDDQAARRALVALPGVGPWTADVYLLACLGRPTCGRSGTAPSRSPPPRHSACPRCPTPPGSRRIGERWRPHRSTAARLLWHGYLARRGRVETPATVLG